MYSPLQLKHGKLSKNRFALAPMTNVQSNPDGSIAEAEFHWLLRRAEGGFGIIITCAAHVLPTGQGWAKQMGLFSDSHISGLTHLSRALKKQDTINIIQLFHGGVRSPSKLTHTQPISASRFQLDVPNFETPREATVEELAGIVDAFARATERAVDAGFDGVEIHGANGYLFTQFISTQTNLRHDHFGNSLENRARLLLDTLKACKKRAPKDFIVGVRLSPENGFGQLGLNIFENIQIAQWLEQAGADYIHLSMLDAYKKAEEDPNKTVIELFRHALKDNTILMAAGGIQTLEQAQRLKDSGVDIVAFAKIAIANPDFPINYLKDSTYQPLLPPYTKEYLHSVMVSDPFIEYLSPRPGFVLTNKDSL